MKMLQAAPKNQPRRVSSDSAWPLRGVDGKTFAERRKEQENIMPIVRRSVNVWTPEMDAELLGYYEHGLRPAYMAERMGLTIASVEGRYRKLKKRLEQSK
jgi:DNA-directed RNA polymerase specialized sigma24 family protein